MKRESPKTLSTRCRMLVFIQARSLVRDGEGGFAEGWANTTTSPIWAAIDPIQARQRTEYSTVDVEATHLVRVRGDVGIDEKYRVVYGARIFEVRTVENLQERGVEKVCTCREIRT